MGTKTLVHTPDARVIIHNYENVESPSYDGTKTTEAVKETNTTIIDISDYVVNVNISKQKNDPSQQASITLTSVSEIFSTINVSSWIFIYLKTEEINKKELENTEVTISEKEKIKEYKHPLKFLGIISSLRRSQQIDNRSGAIITRYSINAVGFGYLLSTNLLIHNMFFNNENNQALKELIAETNLQQDTIKWTSKEALNNVMSFVKNIQNSNVEATIETKDEEGVHKGVIKAVPTSAPIVPPSVSKNLKLGETQFFKCLSLSSGIDRRGSWENPDIFAIDYEELLGARYFYPTQIFSQGTVYSLLLEYMNPTTNEIIVDLMIRDGKLQPSIIHRQIPFNSPEYKAGSGIKASYFNDLFSTKISKDIIIAEDLGYSIHNQMNLVFPLGDNQLSNSSSNKVTLNAFTLSNLPLIDYDSISKIGLHAHMPRAPFVLSDTITKPQEWGNLIADWYFNSHRYLSGTVQTLGIDNVLCLGDNVEIENKDFNSSYLGHIESINYQFNVDELGRKTYRTVLGLSRIIDKNMKSFTGHNKDKKMDNEFTKYSDQRTKLSKLQKEN